MSGGMDEELSRLRAESDRLSRQEDLNRIKLYKLMIENLKAGHTAIAIATLQELADDLIQRIGKE